MADRTPLGGQDVASREGAAEMPLPPAPACLSMKKTAGLWLPSGVAGLPAICEFGEVGAPALFVVAAEFVQRAPGEYPAGMAVVEMQQHRVIAHRLDGGDVDVSLAGDQHLLAGAVRFSEAEA